MARNIVILVVILALIGGGLWYAGILKPKADGTVGVDTSSVEKMATDAQNSTTEGYGAAGAAFASNKYVDAIKLYKAALAKMPADAAAPEARFRIGKSYEELNQPSDALAAYREYVTGGDTDKERLKRGNDRIAFLENSGTK